MYATFENFGLMTITIHTTDGDTVTTSKTFGYLDAVRKLNELRELFDIESALFVCNLTGEIIAEFHKM